MNITLDQIKGIAKEKYISKFKGCKHPNTKQGCCDFCGKDMIGE